MVASLLETILITNLLCGSAHYSPAPRWVRVFVLHILGCLVLLPPKSREQEDMVIQNPAAQGRISDLQCGLTRARLFTQTCALEDLCSGVRAGITFYLMSSATEINVSSLVEENNEAPEQKGPLDEDKALQELRSLGRDLEALNLWVQQQLSGSQSAEEWIQVGLIIDRLLFLLYILFISVSFITMIIFWLK